MENKEEVIKQLGRSGFPFQIRVEHEVTTTQSQHGWSVASREQPWRNPDTESSGFIDVVLQHDRLSTCRIVVECKRIKADDARQLRWLFLLPAGDRGPAYRASCFEVEGRVAATAGKSPIWQDLRVWDNVRLYPESHESAFCVLPNDEQRNRPILENLASDVLESCEGLAEEEVRVEKSQSSHHIRLFIFPIIVTNAELAVCQFAPGAIQISDGTIDASEVDLRPVPYVRFRKSLATNFPEGQMFRNLQGANAARERTVIIVNATCLPDFLKDWGLEPHQEYATQNWSPN